MKIPALPKRKPPGGMGALSPVPEGGHPSLKVHPAHELSTASSSVKKMLKKVLKAKNEL
jgi:hypothetical protein